MNLQRKHLGIRGKCVNCGDPLVATERPGVGVVALNPDLPELGFHSPGFAPEAPGIEAGRESAGGAAHHSPGEQSFEPRFSIPTGGSSETFAGPGGVMPGPEQMRPEIRDARPDSVPSGSRSRLEEGFASLFKKQPDGDEASGNPVAPPPLATVPERNLGGDHPSLLSDGSAAVPWAEQARKDNPFDRPRRPDLPEKAKEPFADRLENPISRSVKEAGGSFPGAIGQEVVGSGAGSWPGTAPIEESGPSDAAGSGKQMPSGGFPGVSVAQLNTGRRNIFVRLLLGLMKLAVTLAVIGGIGAGVYFLTPPDKMKRWQEAAIEWLQPGLVLRDHLPFKVPFLEKLAREDMLENGTSKTVTHAGTAAPESPEPEAIPHPEEAAPALTPEPGETGKAQGPPLPDSPPAAAPARAKETPAGGAGESVVEIPGNQALEPAVVVSGEPDRPRPIPIPRRLPPR